MGDTGRASQRLNCCHWASRGKSRQVAAGQASVSSRRPALLVASGMGKERRESKLARRATIAQAQADVKFNWKSFLPVMLRVALKVFGLLLVAITLQLVLVAIGIQFFASSVGQLLLVLALYIGFFRWVNAETMQFRKKQEQAEQLLEKHKPQP
jgi:hypothetical protein